MDEYNINNFQKINAINFININEDKSTRPTNPFYKKNQIQYLNPMNKLEHSQKIEKGKYSQRNFSKITPKKSQNISEAKQNSNKYYQSDVEHISSNANNSPFPLASVSLYQPRAINIINNNKKAKSIRKIIKPNNNDVYNNNTYDFEYNFIDNSKNEMKLKNKNILYEKQIHEAKNQNKRLINKLNIYLNDIKKKAQEINSLQQKNRLLQIELNKNANTEKNNNLNRQNMKPMQYQSKSSNIIKNNSKIIINSREQSGLKNNINQQNNSEIIDMDIKKQFEQKDNQIRFLYQKVQKMKKEISLMSLKNANLSKLLTKKNIDLIGYQKNELDKEKQIEHLTSLLFQQSLNNKSISNKLNNDGEMNQVASSEDEKKYNQFNQRIKFLENEIKTRNLKLKGLSEENKEKNKTIEELVNKLNNMEIDIKGLKSEEKKNFFDIKKYKNDLESKDGEIKDISKKLKNCQTEKLNLLNAINNKDKEININRNQLLELKNDLENNKKIIEQKDKEIEKYINNNQGLLNELNNNKNIINNSNKEDKALLKKIEELSISNNKLLEQINTVNSKYHEQKKTLSDTNKKLQEMKDINKSLLEKEKQKALENDQKNYVNPEICKIITNKRYKNLIWYLIYKNPKNKNNIIEDNNYENYFWVTNSVITNDELKKFNKFEDENEQNKDLKDYITDLHKKLEKKEESINKLDLQNKKLTKELLNKTANPKGNILLPKNSKDDNFANSFNNNKTIENEIKYKNIFEKLNQREKHLNNQIILLKEQLNEKKNLENNFPHDMKHIDPHLHDSGFLDDDSENSKNLEIQNFVSNEISASKKNNEINNNESTKNNKEEKDKENNDIINDKEDELNNNIEKMDLNEHLSKYEELNKVPSKDDPFKESEKLVDEFLMKGAGDEDDYDEVKMINKQMNFLKEEIKENREKHKKLGNEIKELFTKIKCNDKNRKNIVQICQLLGFTPQLVDQIISNKKPKK